MRLVFCVASVGSVSVGVVVDGVIVLWWWWCSCACVLDIGVVVGRDRCVVVWFLVVDVVVGLGG